MILEIYNQEIRISVDSFVTMKLCGTPTETPLFQHGRSLLPVTDCQLLCSGRWPSKLKKRENFVLSVLLKRADWREVPPSIGRDSWGDLVSQNILNWKFFSPKISNWNFCLQRYLWSPWHLCFWVPGHPTSDWHKQVHNWWVYISFEKYENHLFSFHQVDSDHISWPFVDPMSLWPAPRYHRWFKQIGKLG